MMGVNFCAPRDTYLMMMMMTMTSCRVLPFLWCVVVPELAGRTVGTISGCLYWQ